MVNKVLTFEYRFNPLRNASIRLLPYGKSRRAAANSHHGARSKRRRRVFQRIERR